MTNRQPALFVVEKNPEYKKSKEIHKRNELVRASLGEVSIHSYKLLNAFYYLIQKNELYEEGWNSTTFKELRDLMRLESTNTYVQVIEDALTCLAKPIPLKNYTDINGKKWNFKLMKFLEDARVAKETEWKVEFKIFPDMLDIIKIKQEEGNWTKLDFYRHVNIFKSKYTMKFYEYIVSFRRLKSTIIRHETLKEILNSDKSFSELVRIVERCEKEIKEHDPFMRSIQSVKNKKEKYITYYFDQEQETGKKLSLQQFIYKVKEAYAGQAFVKPYLIGITKYKRKARLAISNDSKLVVNENSGTVLKPEEAEEVFKLLFEKEDFLGNVAKSYTDYIDEKIKINDDVFTILDIREEGDFKIRLQDKDGRSGWMAKTYKEEEKLIQKIEETLYEG
jgi:hypothetical protein